MATTFCIVSRVEAMAFLSQHQASYRMEAIWNGSGWSRGNKRKLPRHARGAGPQVDLINYGLRNERGKLVAVARITPTPYGNGPARAAVGQRLASHVAYLSRQCAVGISSAELVQFIQDYTSRFRADMLARNAEREAQGKPPFDYRYLLSLDDPTARLIESRGWGILAESAACTGAVYLKSGALDAGETRSKPRATRYIQDGRVKSVYHSGRNLLAQLRAENVPLIREGAKRRFVWVLAPAQSWEYSAWRRALPAWVREPVWGENGLGWSQPRLLTALPALQPS